MEDDKKLHHSTENEGHKDESVPVQALEYYAKYSLNRELPKYFCGASITDWHSSEDQRFIEPIPIQLNKNVRNSRNKPPVLILENINETPKLGGNEENVVATSPASSVASNRKLEWDNGADIGYDNVTVHRTLQKSISLPILNKFEYRELQNKLLGELTTKNKVEHPVNKQSSSSSSSRNNYVGDEGFIPVSSSTSSSGANRRKSNSVITSTSSSSPPLQRQLLSECDTGDETTSTSLQNKIGVPIAESTPFNLQKSSNPQVAKVRQTFNADINTVDKISNYKHFKLLKLSASTPVVVECVCNNVSLSKNAQSKSIQTSLIRNVSVGIQTDLSFVQQKSIASKNQERQSVFFMYHSDSDDRNTNNSSVQTNDSEMMLSNHCQSFEFLNGNELDGKWGNLQRSSPKSDLTSLPKRDNSTTSNSSPQTTDNSERTSASSPLAQLLASRELHCRIPDFQKKIELIQKMLNSCKYNNSTKKFYLKQVLKKMFDTRYSDDSCTSELSQNLKIPVKSDEHDNIQLQQNKPWVPIRSRNLQTETFTNEILPQLDNMTYFAPIKPPRLSRNRLFTLTSNDDKTSPSLTESPYVSPNNQTSPSQNGSNKTWRDSKTRSEQRLEQMGDGDSVLQKPVKKGFEDDLAWINKEILHLNKLKKKLKENETENIIQTVLHKPYTEGVKQSTTVYVLTTETGKDFVCRNCRPETCTNPHCLRYQAMHGRTRVNTICTCIRRSPLNHCEQADRCQLYCKTQSKSYGTSAYQYDSPPAPYTPLQFQQAESQPVPDPLDPSEFTAQAEKSCARHRMNVEQGVAPSSHPQMVESQKRPSSPTRISPKHSINVEQGVASSGQPKPKESIQRSLSPQRISPKHCTNLEQSVGLSRNPESLQRSLSPTRTSPRHTIYSEEVNSQPILSIQRSLSPTTISRNSKTLKQGTSSSSSHPLVARSNSPLHFSAESEQVTAMHSLPSTSSSTKPKIYPCSTINEETSAAHRPALTAAPSKSSTSKSSVRSYTIEFPMEASKNKPKCKCPCFTQKDAKPCRLVQELVCVGSIESDIKNAPPKNWITTSENVNKKKCTCCSTCLGHAGRLNTNSKSNQASVEHDNKYIQGGINENPSNSSIEAQRILTSNGDDKNIMQLQRKATVPQELGDDLQADHFSRMNDGIPDWKRKDQYIQTSDSLLKVNSKQSTSSTNSSSQSSSTSSISISELCIPLPNMNNNINNTCRCCNRQINVSSVPGYNSKYTLCHACYNQHRPTSYYTYPGTTCKCHVQTTQMLQEIRDTVNELNMLEKDTNNFCQCHNSLRQHASDYCLHCKCKIKDKHFSKKGIGYTLTLEPDRKKHHKNKGKHQRSSVDETKVQKHNTKKHNRKHSTSSSDGGYNKENSTKKQKQRKNNHKKKSGKKRTLQDYLFVNKPDFIASAEQRRQCLIDLAYMREQRYRKYKQLLAALADLSLSKGIPLQNLTVNNQESGPKHLFTAAEMKQITAKHYKKLPEVQQKLTDYRERQVRKANKLLTDIFNHKLRQQALRGKVTIPTTTSIIKLD